MTKDELLKLVTVLQAELEATNKQVEILSDVLAESRREVAAIKQARSAPVQEPVAIALNTGTKQGVKWLKNVEHGVNLYTAQPASASWMEMVTANLVREGIGKHKARELAEHFYSLAQRPWVGLTDEEVMQTMSGDWTSQFYFARAIETKLRSKNNG